MEQRELSQLKPNPNNPRGEVIVDDALRELAESIKEQGVLQPILVLPDGTIVIGHRRVKAAELAGLDAVPVVVRELSGSQQIQIMLIENLQREDLTALQIAKAYQTLTDHGLSINEIAKATGFRPDSVSKHLNILKLPDELHHCFDGEFAIPLGGVCHLLKLSPADQLGIGKLAAQERWLITEIAQAVNQGNPKKTYTTPSRFSSLATIVSQLEAIDEKLGRYPELKAAQNLLRQASRQLINGMEKARSAA